MAVRRVDSLPIEGGVAAAFRFEIAAAPEPKCCERETEAELRAVAALFRTGQAFGVADTVDSRETRPYLCRFIDAAQSNLRTQRGPNRKLGVRP